MRKQQTYYVYIMGSLSGTLYVGVTGHIRRRVWQHKQHDPEGFTSRYAVDRLLYWERFGHIGDAIAREKQLKGWRREKKIALIMSMNPHWVDLSREWYRTTLRITGRDASAPQDDSLPESPRSAQHDITAK